MAQILIDKIIKSFFFKVNLIAVALLNRAEKEIKIVVIQPNKKILSVKLHYTFLFLNNIF